MTENPMTSSDSGEKFGYGEGLYRCPSESHHPVMMGASVCRQAICGIPEQLAERDIYPALHQYNLDTYLAHCHLHLDSALAKVPDNVRCYSRKPYTLVKTNHFLNPIAVEL